MCQFSVYMRLCTGKEQTEAVTKRIQKELPQSGHVEILYFTDKQYESIVSFHGKTQDDPKKNPDQYALF